MTKDGRPSPLYDTRLYGGNGVTSLDSPAAFAFAHRLTWWLNGEGFSIGHTPALYVVYTPELPIDAVEAEAPRFTPDDWWFRTVRVGVPRDSSPQDAEQIARRGLIACLKALKPEDSALIDKADEIVTTAGNNCRFLLKVRDLAKQTIEISTTISVHREPSLFYVAMTDKTTGAYREAPPAKIQSYDDGIYLARRVKIARRGVEIVPRTSYLARLIVERNPDAATWNMDEFVDAERPVISGLLKFK